MDERQPSRYRILSPIGEGGMGSVSLAEDFELGRKVCLKFLSRAYVGDPSARRRLIREATAAAQLDHPFICKVYDVGELEGEPFIAMEYVEGRTLKERLSEGPIPLPEALRLAGEMAEALDCAQKHGVVHRDVKPANVMLAGNGHPKVMDFGIAKQLAVGAEDPTEALTTTAGPTGSLPYMSPEQLRGGTVDSRSDIFSFGLVLYEMLTARRPFAGESAIATAAATLDQPAPPLAPYLPDAPPLLGHVIERMLAKDPEERFQTFRDVRNELVSIMTSQAPPARSAAPRSRARRLVAATGVVLVAVVAAILLWPERPALAFAERDWLLIADLENLTGDEVFDRSLATALDVGIAQSQYVNVFPESRVRDALARMQRPANTRIDENVASEIAVREGVKGVLASSVAQVGSVYQLTARLIDPASNAVVWSESVQAEDKSGVLPALDELATRVRRGLGESLRMVSAQHLPLPQATTASLDALKLFADADTEDGDTKIRLLEEAVALDPDFAIAHATLGVLYYMQSDRATRMKGEEHITKALGLLDRLSFRERLLITALAEDARGDRDAAVAAYNAYLRAYPDDSDVWFRLGWTYMAALAQYEQGAEAFRHVIDIYPRAVGALINLASCYSGLGQDQEARDAYERAFAQSPAEMFGDFVNHEYGFTLVRLGALDRAAEVFQEMTAQAAAGKRAKGYRSLALLDTYRGRYRAAETSFEQAIVLDRTVRSEVSEFRDRLYLARTLWARDETRAFDEEVGRIEALASRMVLGPEWVHHAVKLLARSGRTREARRLLAATGGSAQDPTSDSSINRNTGNDAAYLDIARAELALAEGRADEAVTLLSPASEQTGSPDALESLATALLAAGSVDEAARSFEELIADRPLGRESQEYWFRAHLRLAEIRASQGDIDAARSLYQQIVTLWQEGDQDLPALRDARAGLDGLG